MFVVESDGTGLRLLLRRNRKPLARYTPSPDVAESDPSWSPNGRWLALVKSGEVWIAAGGGSEARVLVSRDQGGGFDPAWRPDGKRLLFLQDAPTQPTVNRFTRALSLYSIGRDGTRLRRESRRPVIGEAVSRSPDGIRAAFLAGAVRSLGARTTVRLMSVDGERRSTLLRARRGEAFGPVGWSPDGRQIALIRWRKDARRELQVMNADGTGRRTLARGRFLADAPCWSPDGTRVAVVLVYANRNGGSRQGTITLHVPFTQSTIVVMNAADGSNRRSIFTSRSAIGDLDWQPLP